MTSSVEWSLAGLSLWCHYLGPLCRVSNLSLPWALGWFPDLLSHVICWKPASMIPGMQILMLIRPYFGAITQLHNSYIEPIVSPSLSATPLCFFFKKCLRNNFIHNFKSSGLYSYKHTNECLINVFSLSATAWSNGFLAHHRIPGA